MQFVEISLRCENTNCGDIMSNAQTYRCQFFTVKLCLRCLYFRFPLVWNVFLFPKTGIELKSVRHDLVRRLFQGMLSSAKKYFKRHNYHFDDCTMCNWCELTVSWFLRSSTCTLSNFLVSTYTSSEYRESRSGFYSEPRCLFQLSSNS